MRKTSASHHCDHIGRQKASSNTKRLLPSASSNEYQLPVIDTAMLQFQQLTANPSSSSLRSAGPTNLIHISDLGVEKNKLLSSRDSDADSHFFSGLDEINIEQSLASAGIEQSLASAGIEQSLASAGIEQSPNSLSVEQPIQPDLSNKYIGILDHEYRGPKSQPPMPLIDRAVQFAPFAALTGHSDIIKLTEDQDFYETFTTIIDQSLSDDEFGPLIDEL